jgi:hypothetical protein
MNSLISPICPISKKGERFLGAIHIICYIYAPVCVLQIDKRGRLLHLTSSLICRFAKQSWILQFVLLSFVQELIYKWTSAQEPRLVLGYKILIKTALGLGSVKLKLLKIGQDNLSLNNKKSVSAQWIVITVQ